jgi:site-specific DNA-methyltransferase (adenine-specific)
MAMAEYAWTSFPDNAKVFECTPQGTKADPRFHPTQKPVKLYEWLLDRYAKPGDKILDTHAGSASSLVACKRKGFAYWGFEIDPEYYAKARERLDKTTQQITLGGLESEQEKSETEVNRAGTP